MLDELSDILLHWLFFFQIIVPPFEAEKGSFREFKWLRASESGVSPGSKATILDFCPLVFSCLRLLWKHLLDSHSSVINSCAHIFSWSSHNPFYEFTDTTQWPKLLMRGPDIYCSWWAPNSDSWPGVEQQREPGCQRPKIISQSSLSARHLGGILKQGEDPWPQCSVASICSFSQWRRLSIEYNLFSPLSEPAALRVDVSTMF